MQIVDAIGCGCSGAGANLELVSDVEPQMETQFQLVTTQEVDMVTPDDLLLVPESTWLPGAVAYLFAPFPVNTGQWQSDQMVNRFIKNQDGRWYSDPGADVGYPDLMALALAAPIRSVDNPESMKVIDVVVVSPEPPLPSAPVDLEKIAITGKGGVQFDTEIGVEKVVAVQEPLAVKEIAKRIPWWVWALGGVGTIYVLTRK